jgi:hypothetical protein
MLTYETLQEELARFRFYTVELNRKNFNFFVSNNFLPCFEISTAGSTTRIVYTVKKIQDKMFTFGKP